jgi:hypothetical protein
MTVDRARLASLLAGEAARFASEHPGSRALAQRAEASLLGGVPMPCMVRWAGGFPIFAAVIGEYGLPWTWSATCTWRRSTGAPC